ncbi:hypothetical protein GY12_20490 [Micrococcus luteus]|nr:hypothetical protein GY12_20490 [Micrococcus luteus]
MDRNALDQLQNSTVFATDGDKIGSVGQVYLDDVTNEPTFITVKTGLFAPARPSSRCSRPRPPPTASRCPSRSPS